VSKETYYRGKRDLLCADFESVRLYLSLRTTKKCQKRPTIGAKETYYVRTFDAQSGPVHPRFLEVCTKGQKRPTIGAKETYYVRTFDAQSGPVHPRFLEVCTKGQKRPTIGAKETYYVRTSLP